MSFIPYDEYKKTNLQYINKVPIHWKVLRTDAILSYRKKVVGHEELKYQTVFHYSIPSIEETGDGQLEQGENISSSKIILNGGELLVSKLNPGKSRVIITSRSEETIVCSTEFVPLIPKGECDISFIKYLYLSESIKQVISARVQSATRSHQRAQPSDIYKLWIALPPYTEQLVISRFLDKETSKIDQLIEKKQRLIELLQEKRQALITKAVTKGLDPNVPMKDSGIPWLGEVPEHWEVTSIKNIVKVKDGTHDTPKYVEPAIDTYPLVTSKDIKNGDITFENAKHIDYYDHLTISKRSDVKLNDIIMPMIGTIGNPVIVKTRKSFSIKNVALFKTSLLPEMTTKFLYYLLNSNLVSTQLNILNRGGVQAFVSLDILRNLIVFKIPYSEISNIVTYLDKLTLTVDSLINKLQTQITKLQEYRQALITAAVTGKIDVREKVSS